MSEERGEEGAVLLLEGRGKDQRRRKPWRDGAEPGTEEAHVTRGAERSVGWTRRICSDPNQIQVLGVGFKIRD